MIVHGVVLLVALASSASPTNASETSTASAVPYRTQSERIEDLEDQLFELAEKLRQHEEVPIRRGISVEVGGYLDFGFFVPQGDGSGFVQDFGNQRFPEYRDQFAWTFLGDILAPQVNSRGEVADIGETPGRQRFDSIDSRGAPGFLVNEANLRVKVGLSESVVLTTSLNFVPRSGDEFALGDFFDLDLAQLEWVAFDNPATSIFVGKIDPVIGIEYKQRRANQRFGVTPSLIQRYNSGTQLGLKARTKLFGDLLILAAAITNGSPTTEQFHFYDEVDANGGKSVSGRAALNLPFASWVPEFGGTLEIGLSGAVGPQDRARDSGGLFHLIGVDLEYARSDLAVRAEWLRGGAPGRAVDDAYGLRLRSSGYLELNWMVLPSLGAMIRADLRDAFVFLGSERAYLTKSWRLTVGGRVVLMEHVILKLEALHNGEYGGIPQIPNSVITSSLLVTY